MTADSKGPNMSERRPTSQYDNFAKQTPSGEFWKEPISRRGFFTRMGRLAIVAGAADTLAGELLWGGTNPEIHTIVDEVAKRRFPDTYTLAIGGFNVANVKGLGNAVGAMLSDYGQTAYLQNSSNGLHLGDMEREALRFVQDNKVARLRLYGHSMGGMVAIQLADYLKDKVEFLEAIILDCTPASYHDVRGGEQAGTWFLHAMDQLSLHLGPTARFAIEATPPFFGGENPLEVGVNAMNKAFSSETCSNKLVQSQASLVRTFNVYDYKDSFDERTHILHLRPEDYGADGTVDNSTAHLGWCNGLARQVIDVPIKNGGHANPGQCSEGYKAAVVAAADYYKFYNGKNHRSGRRAV